MGCIKSCLVALLLIVLAFPVYGCAAALVYKYMLAIVYKPIECKYIMCGKPICVKGDCYVNTDVVMSGGSGGGGGSGEGNGSGTVTVYSTTTPFNCVVNKTHRCWFDQKEVTFEDPKTTDLLWLVILAGCLVLAYTSFMISVAVL
jgi:hypothetical protein